MASSGGGSVRSDGWPPDLSHALRTRALESTPAAGAFDRLSPQETLHWLEESRIQRIELEMQNEELRRALDELERSQERYFDLYDLAPVGYITVDDRGTILEINLRAAALFGTSRSAAVARLNLPRFIAPEDQDVYFLTRRRLFHSGDPQGCELRILRPGQPPIWARLKMTAAQENEARVARIAIIDITELKLAEQRFDAFMTFSPAGASIVDEEGRYVYVNPAMKRHANRHDESWVGKTFFDVWPAATAQWLKERHVASLRGRAVTAETTTFQVYGQKRFYELLNFTFNGPGGTNLVGSISIDVTERQRSEELSQANIRLLAAEKEAADEATRAKSHFISTMSHEIRTPLNGVIGMTDLLLNTELTTEQLGYAHIVADSAEVLLGLVNNILDFSKIEAGKMELDEAPFDLECLIEDVLEAMSFKAREKSLELACWYPAEAGRHFAGDAGRVRQILTNFVSNAIKFTDSGYVLVEVKASEDRDAHSDVVIAIHDTGIGIAKENLERLFADFSQAHPGIARRFGGTGLGLSIVKQIVHLMGGTLDVESMEGEGSTFTCTLPLKVQTAHSVVPLKDDCLAGLHVLAGGNGLLGRMVTAEWCQQWGMKVKQCGLDAVPRLLSAAAEQGRPFQLVILDGCWQDISAAVSEYRSKGGSAVPKLVLLNSDSLEKIKDLGADAILTKPVKASILRERLREIVSGGRSRTSPASRLSTVEPSLAAESQAIKVLVTDDNVINRKLACALLAKLGCDVDTADSGAAALEKVAQQEYGLVLMDLVMPQMDGFAAATAIRKLDGRRAGVPIVALTASATTEDRQHCFAVGMNDFLTKPIRLEQLAECLAKWRSQNALG